MLAYQNIQQDWLEYQGIPLPKDVNNACKSASEEWRILLPSSEKEYIDFYQSSKNYLFDPLTFALTTRRRLQFLKYKKIIQTIK